MNAKTIYSSRLSKNFLLCGATVVAGLALLATSAQALVLSWDPNSTGGPSDGNGIWHTTNVWYNGTNDQTWTNLATNNIGTATNPGNYTITMDSPATAALMTFRSNNYTIAGASTLTYSNTLILAPGATTTINCPLAGTTGGGAGITVSNGGTLTLGNGFVSAGGNPSYNGTNPTNSFLFLTNGTYSAGGTETYNNITATQTGGAVAYAIWNIGRTAAATYNLTGGTLRNTTVNAFSISRGFPGTVNVSGTGLLGTLGNLPISGNSVTDTGTLNVLGGTVNVGSGIGGTPGVSSASLANITLIALGTAGTFSGPANGAALNISGGVVTAKEIQFGSSVSSYVNHPFANLTLSGGSLYLDSGGIALGSGVTGLTNAVINLSGGTLAATANWVSSVAMTLTNVNGSLNVQAGDTNGTPFNIAFSGGLSGSGGLNKTGNGNLTLSGANTFTGATVVSNGQFTMRTGGAESVGSVTLNTGTTLSSLLSATGQSWTNTGLTAPAGTTFDFNFGGFQASPVSRVIQVNGNLTLDGSDSVTVEGTALLNGTYPLITCTGILTLTGGSGLPSNLSLPGGVSGHLAQNGNTIDLVVTASPNVFLQWGSAATGPWNFLATNWINSSTGNPTNYSDGLAVTFNDNSNNAVVISLNTTVQPGNITANNTIGGTVSYTITGSGAIAGSASVVLQGTGTLALGTSNTYSGGTTVNSGTLAINNGGDGFSTSAIGTGILSLNAGATLDNTSGTNIVLATSVPEYWFGNFSYAGSSGNLDLGPGYALMQTTPIVVTVLSNNLTYSGPIYDGNGSDQLIVQGPGSLTLAGASGYSGGTTLTSGKLNINYGGDGNADSAVGVGLFTISGGVIDNTSGATVQLLPAIPEAWNANFAFAGTTNLDLGSGTLNIATVALSLQNGSTLRSEGSLTAVGSGAVATLTLTGNGVFQASGSKNDPGLTVDVTNGATFLMDKSIAAAHSVGGGLIVDAGGTARITGTGGQQVINSTLGPVRLSGGLLDIFGSTEKMFSINFVSGTLENSSANAASLTLASTFTLTGAACNFDVASNSSLTIPNPISGAGSLVKVDAGTLNIPGTNTYTGSTTVSNGLVTITTATLANRNYTVAGGELEVFLDPAGLSLQMAMSNLTFGPGVRLGFDLASGVFGDAVAPVISAGALTMSSNVLVDVSNAPADANSDILLTYTSRTGPGLFVPGNLPVGAFLYDNTAARMVILTYTQPPASSPTITGVSSVFNGSVVTGLTFTGIRGPADSSFEIVSSTDLNLKPLSAWTPVQSGAFDDEGNFSITIPVTPGAPQKYYMVRVP